MRGPTARPNNRSPKNNPTNTKRSYPIHAPPKKRQRRFALQPRVGRTIEDLPWDQHPRSRTATRFRPSPHAPAKRKQHASTRTKNSPHPRPSRPPALPSPPSTKGSHYESPGQRPGKRANPKMREPTARPNNAKQPHKHQTI
jgi:hypothetical protein